MKILYWWRYCGAVRVFWEDKISAAAVSYQPLAQQRNKICGWMDAHTGCTSRDNGNSVTMHYSNHPARYNINRCGAQAKLEIQHFTYIGAIETRPSYTRTSRLSDFVDLDFDLERVLEDRDLDLDRRDRLRLLPDFLDRSDLLSSMSS